MAGGRIISLVDAAKQRIAALRDPAAKVSGGWKGRLPGLSPRPSPETGLAPDAVSTGSPRLAASRLTLPRFALPGIAPPAEITSLPRKLALGVTVLAVALGAGRFVQSDHEARRMDIAEGRPSAITPLAASADFAAPRLLPELGLLPELAKPVPVADRAADAEPVRTVGALPAAETDPAQPGPEDVGALREPGTPPGQPTEVVAGAADPCLPSLVGMPAAGAVIDIVLLTPCAPETDVVLRHAGLALSGKTSVSGTLFFSLPALDPAGRVTLRMRDGSELVTEVPTNLTGLRRVAVQWQGADRFQLHAFENGADYGAPGHVWTGATEGAGALMRLGSEEVDMPLLAEVYTFPADPALSVRITVEAEVTAATCDRDILGEALALRSGVVETAELALTMPDCGAIGDFLVLNNPFADTTLLTAAATD